MFRPVNAKPDLVAQEHEILAEWLARRTFEVRARLTPLGDFTPL